MIVLILNRLAIFEIVAKGLLTIPFAKTFRFLY